MVWNELAKKYDSIWLQKYSLAPTRNRVVEIINRLHNTAAPRVLDIGCGTGQLLAQLAAAYPDGEFYGVDKSREMIAAAKKKNLPISFIEADVCDPSFDFDHLGSMDFIVCCHSFPYYTAKELLLHKVARQLKPDGNAIFIQASINNMYDKLVMWVIEKTAENAQYLSAAAFEQMVSEEFQIIDRFYIKERFYMASIFGLVLGVVSH